MITLDTAESCSSALCCLQRITRAEIFIVPCTINSMSTVLFLLVGLAVGVISGMVGLGGGVFIIPILVYGFNMSQHKAQGTSLGSLLAPIGLLAFIEYYKAGNVDLRAAIMIAVGFLLGGYFGGRWAQLVSDTWLRRSFAVLLIGVGIQMLVKSR